MNTATATRTFLIHVNVEMPADTDLSALNELLSTAAHDTDVANRLALFVEQGLDIHLDALDLPVTVAVALAEEI